MIAGESDESIQERYFPTLTCFGCGPSNLKGLQLKSYPDDERVRARFLPWPEHDNGLGYLNGGIIATLLDCHSAAAVVLTSIRSGLVPDGSLQYVTAGLDLSYRRPAPLWEPVDLVAWSTAADAGEIRVEAELWWQDKVRASALATWKRWRPREGQSRPADGH